jgi:hypothetical protein
MTFLTGPIKLSSATAPPEWTSLMAVTADVPDHRQAKAPWAQPPGPPGSVSRAGTAAARIVGKMWECATLDRKYRIVSKS